MRSLFSKVLPTLRAETGCPLSIAAAYLFIAGNGIREFPIEVAKFWDQGKPGGSVVMVVFLALAVFAGLLPFGSVFFGTALHRRLAALSMVFSALFLVGVEGACAAEDISRLYEGRGFFGVSWSALFAVIALLELAILVYGALQFHDDRPFLLSLMGPPQVDSPLFILNISLMLAVLLLGTALDAGSAPQRALLGLHAVFGATWCWKSIKVTVQPAGSR